MALSTAELVKQTFNLIALRHEAKARLTGRQWEKRGELVDRCNRARKQEEKLLFERSDVRIEVARKKVIDEAGSKTREHKPIWAQNDRFDKAATLRLAKQEVRQAHKHRLAQIDQYEERGLSNLLVEAKRENQLQGKAERAFDKVFDRRRGGERRQTHRLKQDR